MTGQPKERLVAVGSRVRNRLQPVFTGTVVGQCSMEWPSTPNMVVWDWDTSPPFGFAWGSEMVTEKGVVTHRGAQVRWEACAASELVVEGEAPDYPGAA